jgi:hypothetical protein
MVEGIIPYGLPQKNHSQFPWTLKNMAVELKTSNIHTQSLDYAIKILMRAREIWPVT